MFALINEMETAIKINISIIFETESHAGEVQLLQSEVESLGGEEKDVDKLLEKHSTNMKGCWECYPFVVGASGDFF